MDTYSCYYNIYVILLFVLCTEGQKLKKKMLIWNSETHTSKYSTQNCFDYLLLPVLLISRLFIIVEKITDQHTDLRIMVCAVLGKFCPLSAKSNFAAITCNFKFIFPSVYTSLLKFHRCVLGLTHWFHC